MFEKDRPYNELPLLPPEIELETKEILKETIAANKALAELKGIAKTIPNQSILISSLPLQEAKLSSEIENVVTTNDKLYEAFVSSSNNYDPQTKEVLRYSEALWEGFNKLKKHGLLTTNVFIEIYRKIKATDAGIRNTPGTRIQNSKGEILYTPPDNENVIREKLKNLEEFIHDKEDKIDPLIKTALIHYQFEAIHPFTDGNGRTGRVINVLYLIQQNYLEYPVLYLSNYIIENKKDYYELLRGVTEKHEWQPWIIYMLNSIKDTSEKAAKKIIQIKELYEKTVIEAKEQLPSRVYSKELIEVIFTQPYSKVEFIVNAGIAKRQTTAEYLKELEKINILKSKKVGKEVLYLNLRLYELLQD